jgi:hypothetical protein
MEPKEISAEELDRLFDEGKEDVLQYFDLDNLRRGVMTPEEQGVSAGEFDRLAEEEKARRGDDPAP